jgi:hypothetical protein
MAEVTQGSPATQEPGTVVQLPGGLLKEGKVHRDAEILPMTGYTRKSIAREDVRTSPTKVTDMIFTQCLRRVGTYSINSRILDELLSGDRDFLLMEIRRVSMGSTVRAEVECEGCRKRLGVTFDLSEINVKRLEDKEYEIIEVDGAGAMAFRMNTDKGVKALCRFSRGLEQKAVVPMFEKNAIAASYKLYTSCLLEWNGQAGPFAPDFFDGLSLPAIDSFAEAFTERQPGPDFKQETDCPSCGKKIQFTFRNSDFLFPLPKQRETI